ncbi:MAG TPA: hypothetical protein VMT67_00835 [Terriglobales bacterium]|nr:hypothetical protein [Terriglobales bacterium]
MFRISIKETHGQRRLVLQGKLIPPWTAEVESAWRHAAEELRGRKLVIDLKDVTVISPDGEDTLFRLMREGAHFTCCGVLTKHMLQRLARRCREVIGSVRPAPLDPESGAEIGESESIVDFLQVQTTTQWKEKS